MYQISLDVNRIRLDERELKRRLGDDGKHVLGDRYPVMENLVKESIMPGCTLRKVEVRHFPDGVDLGFGKISSSHLMKNLEGCKEAYLICVTLGTEGDRLLRRAAAVSVHEQYVTDAFLSAYAESICDHVQESLSVKLKPRFAPGYGDFDISWQKAFLEHSGGREIGIDLTEESLMVPTKSITAVMGIENE